MMLALLLGFVTGWTISMPVGPVNATAILRTLHYGVKHGLAVGIGAAVMDVIYCGGATQINAYLLNSPLINLIFQSVGFFLLVYLGIKSLRPANQKKELMTEKDEAKEEIAEKRVEKLHVKQGSLVGSALLGVVLYASNIASLPEWVFITSFLRQEHWLEQGYTASVSFAIGAGIGTAGWFFLLTRYFSKKKTTIKPKTLQTINKFAGIAMLLFGVYFGYQIIFHTDWGKVKERFAGNAGVSLRGGLQPDEAIPFGRVVNFSVEPKEIASSLLDSIEMSLAMTDIETRTTFYP